MDVVETQEFVGREEEEQSEQEPKELSFKDLCHLVAKTSGKTISDVSETLKVFTEVLVDRVYHGDTIKISKVGVFSRVIRKARIGRNPKTGVIVPIDSYYAPKFKMSKVFKQVLKP